MIKYQVTAVETKNGNSVNTLQSKELSKKFTIKKDALKYVKDLQKTFSIISFYTDYYRNGKCTKNIEAIFKNGKYKKLGEIGYKEPKTEKMVINPNEYFSHLFN